MAPAGLRQPQRPQPGARDGGGRGARRPARRLRDPGPPRHGRADPAGRRGAGQPRPGLHPLRGDAAGHGLPGPQAPGKHVERVVPEGQRRRARPGRRPASRPRGDRCHVVQERPPAACPGRRPPTSRRSGTSRSTDFTRPEARGADARGARGRSATSSGGRTTCTIGGEPLDARETFDSTDPGDFSRVVARFPRAEPRHAAKAVEVARKAFDGVVEHARPRTAPTVLVRAAGVDADASGSSWRPGRSTSAASPGARPTPTSPRRSTSASSTPAR